MFRRSMDSRRRSDATMIFEDRMIDERIRCSMKRVGGVDSLSHCDPDAMGRAWLSLCLYAKNPIKYAGMVSLVAEDERVYVQSHGIEVISIDARKDYVMSVSRGASILCVFECVYVAERGLKEEVHVLDNPEWTRTHMQNFFKNRLVTTVQQFILQVVSLPPLSTLSIVG